MRWDNLFDDLESQLEQGLSAEEVDLQAEEERLRLGRLSLRDRIVAVHEAENQASDHGLRMSLRGGRLVVLSPVAFGKDWLSADLVDGSERRAQCILPLQAIEALVLTRQQVSHSVRAPQEPERGVASRLGLAFVLRDLCRRRRAVTLQLPHGEFHGTIDRVGRDHLDLAVHDSGTARRDTAVSSYRVIPLDQLVLVLL
jgi:hypothetical protein